MVENSAKSAEPTSSSEKERLCFVICPIGADGGETRKRSDKLLKYVIRPIMEDAGFTVERADQLSQPGIITNQIVRKILDCDILIADLSEGNPNVFYELAIRHGSGKPFVHMIDQKEKIPFDNAQVRTIQIDLSDLDSVDKAKTELKAQIATILRDPKLVESPLSFALDLEALKSSGNADEQVLGAIFREVNRLGGEVRALRRMQNSPARKDEMSEADLKELLEGGGFENLAAYIGSTVKIKGIRSRQVKFDSVLTSEEDSEFAADLAAALGKITGQRWIVEYDYGF